MFVVSLARWFQGASPSSDGDVGHRPGQAHSSAAKVLDEFGDEVDVDAVPEDVYQKFQSATAFVQTVTDRVPQARLLQLYGLYKLATCGLADPKERPSLFDQRGRHKFDAWVAAGSLSKAEAMEEYASQVNSLNLGWDPAVKSKASSGAFGMRPSRPKHEAEDVDEFEAAVSSTDPMSRERALWFAACKGDDLETAQRLLEENGTLLEQNDDHLGMTALQWAIDSGADSVVEWLIAEGANVDAQDPEGNSPLHFAAYCGREAVMRLLIAAKADRTLRNNDGITAAEAADENAETRWLGDLLR